MKQLVVLSGKGGTGKTSVSAALADIASRERSVVLVDADADAANLGLLWDLDPLEERPFYGADLAVIDPDLCVACGACAEVCRFDGIVPDDVYSVDATACEGCGACALECPVTAIRMEPVRAGSELHAKTRVGPLFHGDLLPGQENSGKLVAALRRSAIERAKADDADLVFIDGPPGIGCPVLAASTGADLAVLVTEPSLSALHDLERVLDTVVQLGIPAVACLNKADLHQGAADRIRAYLSARGVPLVGTIPFHDGLRQSVERGVPATALGDGPLNQLFEEIWRSVAKVLDGAVPAPCANSLQCPLASKIGSP